MNRSRSPTSPDSHPARFAVPQFFRIVVALVASCVAVAAARGAESSWAYPGVSGRLIYAPDAQGDRVLDFSDVGFRGTGVAAIPGDVPTVVTVGPGAGDDTTAINNAIAQAAALPAGANGFRGAVLLLPGDYDVNGQININASGVVLRGSGRDGGGTVLHARGTNQRPLINITGTGSQTLTGSTRNMIDKVVPAGSRSFRVDSTAGFTVGDTVRIERPSTSDWIHDLGMDAIPPRDDGGTVNQWEAGDMNIRFDRVITRHRGGPHLRRRAAGQLV